METLPLFVKYILTALIGMVPIIELRGAIPVRSIYISFKLFRIFYMQFYWKYNSSIFYCKIYKTIIWFFGRWKPFKAIIDWASERATKKIEESEKLQNFAALGLFLFVAIPLPGTGAWVGSLIANFLDLPPKKQFHL